MSARIDMKRSIGILAIAAGVVTNSNHAALGAAYTQELPRSKATRFWVPLGVGPVKGPAAAKVTILAFMDDQDPFSLRASKTIDEVVAAHPADVRYQVIQRPLPFHTKAPFAMRAALAADQQGKFWQMHNLLLTNQNALEATDIEHYAERIGLDLARFKTDLGSATVVNKADLEEANAKSLKISGVPAVFLNGRSVLGAQPRSVFEPVFTEELAYANAILKAGVQPGDFYNTITKLGATEVNHNGAVQGAFDDGEAEIEGPETPPYHAARKILVESTTPKACYEQSLAYKPALSRHVTVDLRLANGQGPRVLLHDSTMNFPKVDNCIVKSLNQLTYPKLAATEQPMLVRYSFAFPAGSAANGQ